MTLKEKLIGGDSVRSEEAKSLVSCRHNDVHLCSGFLITVSNVLTLASCINNFFVDEIIPNFEEYSVVDQGGKSHSIVEVQAHRRYTPEEPVPSSDIAVITVDYYYSYITFMTRHK